MNLSDLHNNETLRQREFPICSSRIYLANAAICPLPRSVAEAISEYALMTTLCDQEKGMPKSLPDEIRQMGADLLNCDREEMALVGPTSVSLSLVANGLTFKPGDNVVYHGADYPSNTVVWMNLAEKGVELRPVEPEEPGKITIDTLKPLVDSNTRLVALASAHYISGYRIDLRAIGSWLKENGRKTLFCVDGIQTLGALPTTVEHVDFLASDSHKWLLGPCSSGLFYVGKDAMEQLRPTLLGWHNVRCPDFLPPKEIVFEVGARRYEAGTDNYLGQAGFHAGLSLLRQYTLSRITEIILGHTCHIREMVRLKDYTLACSDENHLSGITSIHKENIDMAQLHKKLALAKIETSLRIDLKGRQWLRFSPHYYNTLAEIDSALELL